MRNFFRTFFSVKRLAQKIDRFVDYFHCPLEDEVDNWWERKFRHPQTRSTSMVNSIYIFSNLSIPYLHKQQQLLCIMILSLINFEFSKPH